MKKFLLTLTIASAPAYAEPTDTANPAPETQIIDAQSPEMDQGLVDFLAKFKALYNFSVQEYAAVEKLWHECKERYVSITDKLDNIKQTTVSDDMRTKALALIDENLPVGLELAYALNEVKEVTQEMERFNALVIKPATYQESTKILIGVAQKLHTIRTKLEVLIEYTKEIETKALELAQLVEKESDGA